MYFRNQGGGGQVVAASIARWLAGIPPRIAAESRAARETAALIAGVGRGTAATRREDERLRRMDAELPFLVSYVDGLARNGPGPGVPRAAVLRFRPVRRFASSEVLARAAALGFLQLRGAGVEVTPLGHGLGRTAFG